MIPVILSGGSGSRLWPVSRESYPKQFCELFDRSFLRNTYERLKPFGDPHVVTLDTMGSLTLKELTESGLKAEQMVLEPMAKNTATAIARIVFYLKGKMRPTDVIGVFPADHLISDNDAFAEAVTLAVAEAQKGAAVTLGVQPRYAATGFGYIEIESEQRLKISRGAAPKSYPVRQFREKPDSMTAEKYLHTGQHFWNAGIFFFQLEVIETLLRTHMPELCKKMESVRLDGSNLRHVYANIESQSIDYGVMEKTPNLVCIPGDYGWSDVGSWDEMARLEEENTHLRVESKAQVFGHETEKNFVFSSSPKVIALSHVRDLIVVDTPDALLITRRGDSQDVKKLVDRMREARVPEVLEHRFEIRPWGKFEILSDLETHKVKKLIIDPKQQLSYQSHTKRDEHWVVVSGQAEARIEDVVYKLNAGEQIKVLRGQKHRLRNPKEEALIIVEVQTGSYFGEDDIERFEDDYHRV